MPFPLAHPAAVVPLRRVSARWLSFPALVIGSITPDSAYLFRKLKLEEVSHRPWGLIAFSLPVGLLVTLLVYAFRRELVQLLPPRAQALLALGTWRERAPIIVIAFSVLIGAGTHLAWDSFTHAGAWAVQQLPVLKTTVGSFFGHNVKVCRILWYVSSFAGIAGVYLVYGKALRPAQRSGWEETRRAGYLGWLEAFGVSALVVPIELVHDLVRSPGGALLVAMLSLLLVLWVFMIQSRNASRDERRRPEASSTGSNEAGMR